MKKFCGIAAAPGMARAVAITPVKAVNESRAKSLEEARAWCMEQTAELYRKSLEEIGAKGAAIFKAHEALLQDDALYEPVKARLAAGSSLEQAIEGGFEETARLFDSMENEYMRQRADDIRALKKMHLQAVQGAHTGYLIPKGDASFIVAAEALTPADTMRLDRKRLAGLISRTGGATSHVAILAKTLGIPAVTGVDEISEIKNGDELILDGDSGVVTVEPDSETVRIWEAARKRKEEKKRRLSALPEGPVRTAGGKCIRVSINIGGPEDLDHVRLSSIYGVGLYRTEFLFTGSEREPSLEKQEKTYRAVFERLKGKDLIVRTLDIGGDKQIPYLELRKEDNPFLGCRGIRLCLKHKELLKTQLKALLLASGGRSFSIMFPMIDTVEEFQEAKQVFLSAKEEVLVGGSPVSGEIRLGIMIETPAAAICMDLFAKEVDFVSIGSNDLIQYTMAADRGNPQVSGLLSPFQPGVRRLICHVIRVCNEYGVKVSVCGEAGSDPAFLELMIKAGLRYVSVSPALAEDIRLRITEIQ